MFAIHAQMFASPPAGLVNVENAAYVLGQDNVIKFTLFPANHACACRACFAVGNRQSAATASCLMGLMQRWKHGRSEWATLNFNTLPTVVLSEQLDYFILLLRLLDLHALI